MQKTTKAKIAGTLARTNSAKLQEDLRTLNFWEVNHKHAKNSYFWKVGVNRCTRDKIAEQNTFRESLKIGDTTITYRSDCRVGSYYIWTDRLTISIPETSITFGDVAFIIDTIKEILAKRNTAKSA